MKILMRELQNRGWHLVESASYGKESELHNLLAESPGLISIDEVRPNSSPLVLAVREFSLPVGSVDLLAFSAEGDIAIIECKLASNLEIKRKVIGQVLEYGANLWEMRYEQVDEIVRQRAGDSLAETMKNAVNSPDWDEENFRINVENSLANGNFMLIIVVDDINEELTRIVRFMNVCGNPNFEFAAMEMRRFQAEKVEMLVPRVFGLTRVAKPKSTADQGMQWDEPSFFAELHRQHGEETTFGARGILEWAQPKFQVWWGKGKRSGSFVPFFYHKEKQHQLFAVWTYGAVEIYFYWYSFKPPFDAADKRLELLNKLNQIPGVNIPPDGINRRPSFSLSALAKNDGLDQFLSIYDWVVEEIQSS